MAGDECVDPVGGIKVLVGKGWNCKTGRQWTVGSRQWSVDR